MTFTWDDPAWQCKRRFTGAKPFFGTVKIELDKLHYVWRRKRNNEIQPPNHPKKLFHSFVFENVQVLLSESTRNKKIVKSIFPSLDLCEISVFEVFIYLNLHWSESNKFERCLWYSSGVRVCSQWGLSDSYKNNW